MIIRTRHIYAARLCAPGARVWFAHYGFDWSRFVREGLDESVLAATGDPLARRVILCAHKMEG